jgi:hypothetical protein
MKTEYKNMRAKCIDKNNPDEVVLHEVYFEFKDLEGNWVDHTVKVMATDPMDAIRTVSST